jgi:hypothetical protein
MQAGSREPGRRCRQTCLFTFACGCGRYGAGGRAVRPSDAASSPCMVLARSKRCCTVQPVRPGESTIPHTHPTLADRLTLNAQALYHPVEFRRLSLEPGAARIPLLGTRGMSTPNGFPLSARVVAVGRRRSSLPPLLRGESRGVAFALHAPKALTHLPIPPPRSLQSSKPLVCAWNFLSHVACSACPAVSDC